MEVVPWDAVVASQVVDVYVEGLDLGGLGFAGVEPQATGRPPRWSIGAVLRLCVLRYIFVNGVWPGSRSSRSR